MHLKLLSARAALTGPESEGNAARLREQLEKLQQRLNDGNLTTTARKSKQATITLLEKRLHHFDRRTTALEEIDADSIRIETQVALAEDNAPLQAKPDTVSLDVDLASDTMRETWYFSEDDDLIETLESTYSPTAVSL